MHLQVCGEEEKEGNTRARSLAGPGRGEAMGAGARRVCE
jgi:hypothetical protein